MKITMIGTGYVGLVTGTCFADWGHSVVCVDNNASKITGLEHGIISIFEPGLGEMVAKNQALGRLSFTMDLAGALEGTDAVFIAVGTPPRASDGEADLSFIYMAAIQIAETLQRYAVVIVKSTVPVGTGDTVERILASARPIDSFAVVSNPEFLREGSAIDDFRRPDRVVIGTEDETARRVMADIYAPLAEIGTPIVITQRRTAELIKYAANSFLATKITFINEMADLCEQIDADIHELAHGVGLDHRIGESFLKPGPGYGGSCFPKDTLALLHTAQDFGVSLRITENTVAANNARKRKMALKVADAIGGTVDNRTVAVLGLSFKANTDDMREAPSIFLIEALQRAGATIQAFDPVGMEQANKVLDHVAFFNDAYECARNADVVVIVTEWDCFKTLELSRLRSVMRGNTIVDFRNLISAEEAEAHELKLISLGLFARGPGSSSRQSLPQHAPPSAAPAQSAAPGSVL